MNPITPSSTRLSVRLPRLAACLALVFAFGACGGDSLPQGTARTSATPTAEAAAPQETADGEQTADDPATPAPTARPSNDESSETDAAADSGSDAPAIVTADEWVDATANLVGLESECGNVHYLFANPLRNELYVGIAARGMFKLDESGEWTPMGDSAQSASITNRPTWIEYDQANPDRFWQAGIYGDGVYRTDDGGSTFARQGDVSHVDFLSTDVNDPDRRTMLAGGHEDRIVYLSRDAGASWTDIAASLPDGVGFTEFPVVVDETTFLVGSRRGENAGIYRSTDGGESWSVVHQGGISGAPVVDGDNIYWLSEQGPLVVSRNGGETFDVQATGIGGNAVTLSQLGDGRLLTHDDGNVLVSADAGASWAPIGPALPFTPNGVVMTSDQSAVYAWSFTCTFGDGSPVLENSIIRLDITNAAS